VYDCAMKRIERVRLYPTARQSGALDFALDVTRELYNALLQERRDAYRLREVTISSKTQYAEITALRKPASRLDSRLAAVYRDCEDAVLHRLDLAFRAFYRRAKLGKSPGYPRFKPASRWHQLQFSHGNRALTLDPEQKRVSIPGIGDVRLRKGRKVPPFGRAWVVERQGRWYACFECERAVSPLPQNRKLIGIDRGVRILAATSDGTLIRPAGAYARQRQRVLVHQHELERLTTRDASGRACNRNAWQRRKAVSRLARAKEREANIRRDFARKAALAIVTSADVIALEALNIRGMTRSAKGTTEKPGHRVRAKAGLNRALLDAGFGLLRQMIVAKAEEAARTVLEVGARFSSRECSRCGHIARESRRRRRFHCVACGFACHADVNAALVIRRRAQVALMSGLAPAEEAGRRDAPVAA
jgi:putative transposase